MRVIRKFDEFLFDGTVKKRVPDNSRANFLVKESEKSYSFLKTLIKDYKITDENANSIVRLCYDILMEMIRAAMLKAGFSSSGQGAHEAEVSYLRNMRFNELDLQFADQLRYFRNGIIYYGKVLDAEYAKQVFDFLNKTYPKLKKIINTEN